MSATEGASSLILIRHAMPKVEATLPASEWTLSEHGIRDAHRLHLPVLPVLPSTYVLASNELKAVWETSIATGRDSRRFVSDPDLDEVGRDL